MAEPASAGARFAVVAMIVVGGIVGVVAFDRMRGVAEEAGWINPHVRIETQRLEASLSGQRRTGGAAGGAGAATGGATTTASGRPIYGKEVLSVHKEKHRCQDTVNGRLVWGWCLD